jgi:uncharacterized protein YkwD
MFGAVCGRPTGRSIAGAAVAAAGTQTTTAANGAYTLTVPSAMHLYTEASAPGYQSTGLVVLTSRAGGLMIGRAPYSFCFSQSLANAFHSLNNTVNLTPFAQLQPATARALAISGTATVPLESNAAIMLPSGFVSTAPIRVAGTAISLSVPFSKGKGRYLLEINYASGFAAIKTAIFVGVPYSPDAPPPVFQEDPAGATPVALRAAILQQMNAIRALKGLATLKQDPKITAVSQAHTDDIVKAGYAYLHAHIGSDGSTPAQRLSTAGIAYAAMAENIGFGMSTQNVILSLMDSPAHRGAILGKFKSVGIGVSNLNPTTLVVTIDFVG